MERMRRWRRRGWQLLRRSRSEESAVSGCEEGCSITHLRKWTMRMPELALIVHINELVEMTHNLPAVLIVATG